MGKIIAIVHGQFDDAVKCDNFAQWLLESFDLDGETVMVAPAAGFYSSPGIGLNQVRIAYVLNKKSLIKAVAIIKKALEAYPNPK